MTSEEKRASCRANGRNNKGAKSELRKFHSKMNALKLGIYAISRTIPGEKYHELETIHTQMRDHYKPVGPIEAELSRQIAETTWRLRRLEQSEIVALKLSAIELVSRNVSVSDGNADGEIGSSIRLVFADSATPDTSPISEPQVPPEPLSEVEKRKLAAKTYISCMQSELHELVLLKSYTSPDNKSPCLEIESRIQSVIKLLFRLVAGLEAIQERRKTISVPASEVEGAKLDDLIL